MTFIEHAGGSKRIQKLQFRFTGVKLQYFTTLCAILAKIDALTPEITLGVSVILGRDGKNWHILITNNLSKYWS